MGYCARWQIFDVTDESNARLDISIGDSLHLHTIGIERGKCNGMQVR